ncbi:MAG: hypothetical protein JST36_00625 [Bacteroidetes bacterium]|nr:hypothetical protein [Bacteroidota bacterium]
MKRLRIASLILLAIGGFSVAYAQGNRGYQDDIYYNSSDQKAEEAAQTNSASSMATTGQSSDAPIYSSDTDDNMRQYQDEYGADYDDYSYAARINRFYYPFYSRPYYSAFYDPFWYDPFWVDPYWGWSPWRNYSFGVSFGYGPYWSGYSGWNNWYGCGHFPSYYGYGYSPYGGYYSGYWNGYYGGLYQNYGFTGYRTVSYGPRFSLDGRTNSGIRSVGIRNTLRQGVGIDATRLSATPNSDIRTMRADNPRVNQGVRSQSSFGNNEVDIRTIDRGNPNLGSPNIQNNNMGQRDPRIFESRPQRSDRFAEQNNLSGRENQISAPQVERSRGSWFNSRQPESPNSGRSFEQAPREQNFNSGFERSAPSPRMESAPSRNFGGGGGGRSFGGGGGGFSGGRHR